MSEPEAPRSIEKPLDAFVRGGTSTAADDRQRAIRHADAERRRRIQDEQYRVTRAGSDARLHSMQLGGAHSHPSVVLWIKENAKELDPRHFMLCELSAEPGDDDDDRVEMTLYMHCVRCIYRHNRHPEDTVMHIRQANRMFYFDQRPPKWLAARWPDRLWINPEDPNETCTVAGTVTMHERGHCPVCDWTFVIDDSVIHTIN